MKTLFKVLATILPPILIFIACAKVPVTGRQQLSLIPASNMFKMSYSEYDKFLKETPLSKNKEQTAMVKRVGHRIEKAVEEFFAMKGMKDHLKGYKWEFNLFESNVTNAWCMPGGKVAVYEGLMKVARDETGLAVVMGHEIAHAIAEHGNERMSQQMLANFGGIALTVAMKDKPKETQMLWTTVYGVGVQFGAILPYSRLHESEADHLGLIFMAMAGYDPRKAVEFWERMAAEAKGKKPPEFLSTHPSDKTRIRQIKKLLPEAMRYYRKG